MHRARRGRCLGLGSPPPRRHVASMRATRYADPRDDVSKSQRRPLASAPHMRPIPPHADTHRSALMRIVVVGTPGAGKTTAAKTIAAALGLSHIELDFSSLGAGVAGSDKGGSGRIQPSRQRGGRPRRLGGRRQLRGGAPIGLEPRDPPDLAGLRPAGDHVSRHQALARSRRHADRIVGRKQGGLAQLASAKPSDHVGMDDLASTSCTLRGTPRLRRMPAPAGAAAAAAARSRGPGRRAESDSLNMQRRRRGGRDQRFLRGPSSRDIQETSGIANTSHPRPAAK